MFPSRSLARLRHAEQQTRVRSGHCSYSKQRADLFLNSDGKNLVAEKDGPQDLEDIPMQRAKVGRS